MSTKRELWAAIEGIFAYDTGAVDSGIHDESLRHRCAEQVDAMNPDDQRLFFSRSLRDAFLSEEAVASGYGWEDVLGFCRWLDAGGLR